MFRKDIFDEFDVSVIKEFHNRLWTHPEAHVPSYERIHLGNTISLFANTDELVETVMSKPHENGLILPTDNGQDVSSYLKSMLNNEKSEERFRLLTGQKLTYPVNEAMFGDPVGVLNIITVENAKSMLNDTKYRYKTDYYDSDIRDLAGDTSIPEIFKSKHIDRMLGYQKYGLLVNGDPFYAKMEDLTRRFTSYTHLSSDFHSNVFQKIDDAQQGDEFIWMYNRGSGNTLIPLGELKSQMHYRYAVMNEAGRWGEPMNSVGRFADSGLTNWKFNEDSVCIWHIVKGQNEMVRLNQDEARELLESSVHRTFSAMKNGTVIVENHEARRPLYETVEAIPYFEERNVYITCGNGQALAFSVDYNKQDVYTYKGKVSVDSLEQAVQKKYEDTDIREFKVSPFSIPDKTAERLSGTMRDGSILTLTGLYEMHKGRAVSLNQELPRTYELSVPSVKKTRNNEIKK